MKPLKKKYLLFAVAGLITTALFFWDCRKESKGSPDAASKAPPDSQLTFINPAGQSTNLQDEIAQLEKYLAQAPPQSPLRTRLYLAMGETYVKYGAVDKAVECFEEVLKSAPDEKRSYYYLGVLYLARQDTAKAVIYWKRFLELDPNSYMREEIQKLISGK